MCAWVVPSLGSGKNPDTLRVNFLYGQQENSYTENTEVKTQRFTEKTQAFS